MGDLGEGLLRGLLYERDVVDFLSRCAGGNKQLDTVIDLAEEVGGERFAKHDFRAEDGRVHRGRSPAVRNRGGYRRRVASADADHDRHGSEFARGGSAGQQASEVTACEC